MLTPQQIPLEEFDSNIKSNYVGTPSFLIHPCSLFVYIHSRGLFICTRW